MQINLPELSLVALVGVSSSGKSTFARQHFKPTEVISSDYCRALVSDNESNQAATKDAFDLLYYIVNKRLTNGLLTVIDATNIQENARKRILETAKSQHVLPIAIVLNPSQEVLKERHRNRVDRNFHLGVIRNQYIQLKKSINKLRKEGFRRVFILNSVEEIQNAVVERQKLWNNKKDETGPFDLIGDVHGCYEELLLLLEKLGYKVTKQAKTENYGYKITHPQGRKVVFVGDIVDRGENSAETLRIVMSMKASKTAYCVRGNHDDKLYRKLQGRKVNLAHGLEQTVKDLERESAAFRAEVSEFLGRLISHYVFDGGNLVVAHAGLRAKYHGRASGTVRSLAMYGETTGEHDEYGFPIRYNWGAEYEGKAMVVYGHTPVSEARWQNNTIDIDTGCCFGGKLTALRYPERQLVAVEALKTYTKHPKPLKPLVEYVIEKDDGLLHLNDVVNLRRVETRLMGSVGWRESNAIGALETMSRFAIDPRWLIYLPPTMSPTATSTLPDYLEYPTEAFAYYQQMGVKTVICEEKHMGSRAVVIVCQTETVVAQKFGLKGDGIGVVYTRTGRSFFKEKTTEQAFLKRIQTALTKADFWSKMNTNWVCLDCELMPWSAKALKLLETQYAAVGAAAKIAFEATEKILKQAQKQGLPITDLQEQFQKRHQQAAQFSAAYQPYCWEVESLDDYKLAPFHILATEGQLHLNKTHQWHMDTIQALCEHDVVLMPTTYKIVDLDNVDNQAMAVKWWLEMTKNGGEGMVIKPLNWIQFEPNRPQRLVQPAIKCRGREYLRIIYGPEYTLPQHLKRLKQRNLGKKRSMAQREFALGIEALERFIGNRSLRRVHECVFGVLALESDVVDPRL